MDWFEWFVEKFSARRRCVFYKVISALLAGLLMAVTIEHVLGAMNGEEDFSTILFMAYNYAAMGVFLWVVWGKLFVEDAYLMAREDFFNRAERIYLWGYSFAEIIKVELPKRLGKYKGIGFCYEFAAVTMFTLKDVKTARLCYGLEPERGRHSWVEYRKFGVWWVIDPVWICQECVPWPRWICRKQMKITVESVCKYEEFWQGPFVAIIEVLTDREYASQDSSKNRELIERFMTDKSFCALDEVCDTTAY